MIRNSENTQFKKGQKPHNFKGSFKSCQGYVFIYKPEHPFAQGRKRYVMEHRLVMEAKINRYLAEGEVVHHINGIRYDNRIENLVLLKNNKEHRALHRAPNIIDKRCSKCGLIKPLIEFIIRHKQSIKYGHTVYYPSCRKCESDSKKSKLISNRG